MLGIGLIVILAIVAGVLAIVSLIKQPLLPVLLAVAVFLLSIAVAVEHWAGAGLHP